VPALKTALGELETRLGWTRERRQRIGLRLDGGFGTTEVLNGLLSRGYQVVAKSSHSGRVRKLRQTIGAWQPTSSPGRESVAVRHPHRFCRATRQWVIRTPKDKGGYQYAVLARLAPHLLLWGKQWLSRVPSTRRRLQGYGLVRLLRDVWAVPGVIRWWRGWMVSVRFSPLHPLATPLQDSFSVLVRGRVRVGFLR